MLRRPLLFFCPPGAGGGATEMGELKTRGNFVEFWHFLDPYAG